MKKIVTLFAALCCAVMMFGQSYGILVNGNTYFAGEPAGQFEGFTQYLAHVQVNAGDYCQIYDATNEASWVVTLNTSSVSGFTLNSDRYDVTVSGCYDFYIKLKYQQDELYIGNGSDCGSGTPIGGETQDTVPPVVTVSSVPSQATDVMLQAFYWDSYTDHGYGDTRWNTLLSQSEEISSYFDLVWLPPASFSTGGTGYIPRQYSNLSSDWGTANELYQLLDALHDGNSRVVADIVINHCGNYSSSCNFYPLNFGTYGSFSPDNTWITTDDEGGCTGGSHADVGYEGEQNYGSARDWDHQNPNVQAMCRAYLQWMKEQGFDGWRYDYGKGYTHDHINDYNTAAGAYFSVVEYWDGNAANLQARLNDAGWNTTLFDFSTKYNALNDGICAGNYSKCQGAGLPGAGKSKYAVTFVDNHDTFTRSSSEFGGQNNSMTTGMKDRLLQANAFILSMPGIPCVFYPHWVTYKAELKKMIEARHMTGVHSESAVYDEQVEQGGYQATIAGKNGFIVLQLGNKAAGTIANCTKYAYGNGYAIWVHTNDGSVDPEEPETPDTYYIKNNWNGGEWNWEQMTANADSTAWTYTGVFGGTGVNVSTTPQEGALWFATADFLYTVEGYEAQEGDTIQFVFNPAATTVTAILIGRPAVEPQPETPRFRLTGNEAFVGEGRAAWSLDDAFESYSDTMTLNLPAGNFEMQLINSVGDWKGYDALTQPITAGITTNQWGNVCFYMAEPGQITVIYNGSDFFVLGTFAQPERHFYLIGAVNGWDVETAMEFEDRDSLYALTLEELSGAFKILTARDWEQLSYGAPLEQSSLVSLGVPFQMQEWDAANMEANGVFTNVTVELRLIAGIATITVVQNGTSGGDEPQDTTSVDPVVEDITVYTVLPEDWNDLMAYVWINNTGFVQWPGEYMTPTADTFRGQPVYSYTFPETYTNIIFHNGNGVQTPDIVLDATKRYYYGNTWYASWDSVPEEVIVLPAKYYITGSESLMAATGLSSEYAWDAAAIPATSDTTELYLYAGIEYQVSVNLYGTWSRGVYYYNYLTDITPGLTSTPEGFIAFTPAVDGNVTFILNDSVFTILGDFIVRAKDTYFIKNNWNADEWTWNQMQVLDTDSMWWAYSGVFGGNGVNINIAADDEGAAWYPTEDFILYEGGLYPQEMDTVYFVYSVLWRTLEAYVIGRPDTTITPEPQPEERHFYLIGEFNGWNTETAPEFAAMDTFYTITIDTLHGTYKVIGARDWMHGDYGAYAMNDELTIGEPYIMWPAGYNLYTSTTYLNAVLEIRVVGDDVLLTLVSGTPYEVPQEDRHFYLIGNFNDWSTETAPEFALIDSQYVITLDTLAGAFKVIGARDWMHGDYGAYGYGDVINVGGEYNMNAVSSYNLNLNGTYADVTLTLTVTDNVVTLHFVAGTRVVEPATDLDEIRTGSSMYKTIENGALYIYRNGVKYNAAGQIVR